MPEVPETVRQDHELTQEQEEFAVAYTTSPDDSIRGNATKAYQSVYGCAEHSARGGGSRLLRHEGVRARIRELRREAAEAARDRLREWWELVPEAQETVIEAARGQFRGDDDSGRVRLQAAQHILDRAMGTPREMHQLRVEGDGLTVLVAGAEHAPQRGDDAPGRRMVEANSREEDEEEEGQADPYAGLLDALPDDG